MQRHKIPYECQVHIFFRDKWPCHWCHRHIIFAPAIKYLELFVRDSGYAYPISCYHDNWRRDVSPLLDDLGVVLDHLHPRSRGGKGSENNLVSACNKCNSRKSDIQYMDFLEGEHFRRVKGKYGEPMNWDGLSSTFIVLAAKYSDQLTATERKWLRALQSFLSTRGSRNSRND